MDSTTLIGTAGAATILIAFVLNNLNIWKNDDLVYDVCNFIGSALLLIYAILLSSYPFMVLNSIWALSSLRDIVFYIKRVIKK